MEHATTLIGYRDPLARAYLRGLFRRTTDMTCAAEADSFAGLVESLRSDKRITFTLVDVDLLGATEGLGLRYLVDRYPASCFAVLVTNLSQQVVDQLMSEGATGCIPKNLPADALIDAFRVVVGGSPYVPSGYVPGIGASVPEQRPEEMLELTDRQVEVLQLLAVGHSNREISEILGIAEGTVKVHVNAAFRVLGVHNRVRAAAAMRERMGSPERRSHDRASSFTR